jgi:MoxR-like ATPase
MIRAGLVAQALEGYDAEAHEGSVDTAEIQRAELISRFPRADWPELTLEDYALGQDDPDNFCRWMEFRVTQLGSIKGGSARKHHIYREADSGEWWFERDRYGSVEEAWAAVRQGFVDAFEAVAVGDFQLADQIPALRGGPALSTKSLHVYFPTEVLPVCSHSHLQHFLAALGEDTPRYGELGTVALNRLLLAGLRASGQLEGWTTKQMERLLYGSELSPVAGAPQDGPLPDIPGFIASVIDDYGDAAIEVRRGAEDKARVLLDAAAGDMGETALRDLLRLFNLDSYKGKESKVRFSPAFVGATANRLVERLDDVNVWSALLWTGDEPSMLESLGRLLADHKLLPSAGTSFPSMLLYLRASERFAVWLQPTDRGLQRLDPSYQPRRSPGAGDLDDYLAFCSAATQLMRDYEIPAELLDAVLAAASRVDLDEDTEGEETSGDASVWLFQANPAIFDIDRAISEEPRLHWVVRQSRGRVHAGDRVYMWRSGTGAGVIATATVLTDPATALDPLAETYAVDRDAFSQPEPRVELAIDKVLAAPILRADLIDDPVLADLEVIRFPNATNFAVTPEQDAALRALLDEPRELALPKLRTELAEQLLLPESFLAETVEMLVEKGQAIFFGPPGTGKTRTALDLATELTREGGGFDLVQFHPSYAYEDFVGGFRPEETDSGMGVRYTRVDGPLRRIAKQAAAAPQFPFVLIVDEINRGNVPRIFGELLFLLEYRRRDIRLQYWPEELFSLPANLFLIGTMNTADRSIALVDAALRRRFAFVEFSATKPPVSDLLAKWLDRHDLDPEPALILRRLNEAIAEDEFAIGPSYFLNTKGTEPDLERIWRHEIVPLLEEHFYGTPWDRERFSLDRLRGLPDVQA